MRCTSASLPCWCSGPGVKPLAVWAGAAAQSPAPGATGSASCAPLAHLDTLAAHAERRRCCCRRCERLTVLNFEVFCPTPEAQSGECAVGCRRVPAAPAPAHASATTTTWRAHQRAALPHQHWHIADDGRRWHGQEGSSDGGMWRHGAGAAGQLVCAG